MQRLGCQQSCRGTYWCPRCGSLVIKHDPPLGGESVISPLLVEQCRGLQSCLIEAEQLDGIEVLKLLGITESINNTQ